MRLSFLTCLSACSLALAGCAARDARTVVEFGHVVHCSNSPRTKSGLLKVYSAEAWQSVEDGTYSYVHSGYQIQTPTGRCYMDVPNHGKSGGEQPDVVRLPEGQYVVVAADGRRGNTSVPVTVQPGQTTVLHLD